jgi:hypothetical protein
MTYALLDDNLRCTALVDQEPAGGRYVLVRPGTDAGVGRIYNGWTFDAPRWTSYEFLARFTAAERASIRVGSVSDAALADFLMFSQAAQEVVSDDPVTAAGMDYLVQLGILTPARRAEIVS